MHLICQLFGHHRSKRHRVREGHEWRSICLWCRKPMIRLGWHDWRLTDRDRMRAA